MRTDYITRAEAKAMRPRLSRTNRLVLDLCMATGCRVGEVCALPTEAVVKALGNNCWLDVWQPKVSKMRRVQVPRELLQLAKKHAGRKYVFPNRDDPERHRDRHTLTMQMRAVNAAQGARLTAHSLRKLYAVEQYRRTGDLEKVRKKLGHDRQATTVMYATADAQRAAKEKQKKQHRKVR